MSHGPEHQIEHAEHAVHASHDTFNKNVTMSIAIVAAVLACVTMLGHRSHNETLRLQGEALSLRTEAGHKRTESANKWAYYQTKNLTTFGSENSLDILSVVVTREEQKEKLAKIVKGLESNVAKYTGDKDSRSWSPLKTGEGKLAQAKAEAEDLDKASEQLSENAKEKVKESHHEHLKAARLDYGELALQLSVVLCSLAILTKNRGFWFSGIGCGALGALVALSAEVGLFMGGGGHH